MWIFQVESDSVFLFHLFISKRFLLLLFIDVVTLSLISDQQQSTAVLELPIISHVFLSWWRLISCHGIVDFSPLMVDLQPFCLRFVDTYVSQIIELSADIFDSDLQLQQEADINSFSHLMAHNHGVYNVTWPHPGRKFNWNPSSHLTRSKSTNVGLFL